VEDSRLEREIREGAERLAWVKEVLKVRVRHHLRSAARMLVNRY